MINEEIIQANGKLYIGREISVKDLEDLKASHEKSLLFLDQERPKIVEKIASLDNEIKTRTPA